MEEIGSKTHVLAIPLPLQGHINPMLQFCKRLTSKGVMVTLVTVTSANISVQQQFNSIKIEYIFDDDNVEVEASNAAGSVDAFLKRFNIVVLKNLAKLVKENASSGHPVKVVLYDSLMPWAVEILQKLVLQKLHFSLRLVLLRHLQPYPSRNIKNSFGDVEYIAPFIATIGVK